MVVAVFADVHGHADALEAVLAAAEASRRRPTPVAGRHDRAAARTPSTWSGAHARAVRGRADGQPRLRRHGIAPSRRRFGEPGSPAVRSIELARERLSEADLDWMRTRRPAARRGDVQCWHGGPRNAVHEYVGASNAADCLAVQRAGLGLVAHTHVARCLASSARGAVRIRRRRAARSRRRQVAAESRGGRRAGAVARAAGGTRSTARRPTARGGSCSISSGGRRPGSARRTTPRLRARGRAHSVIDDAAVTEIRSASDVEAPRRRDRPARADGRGGSRR